MADELDLETQAFDLVREGKTAELVRRLDAGLPVDVVNEAGDTLLLLAAYYDHADTVAALLERGAEVDHVSGRGQTALVAAVFRRSEVNVRALLAAGADPHAGGPNALETASFFGVPEFTDLLRPSGQ